MTLISLLIALACERIIQSTPVWQGQTHAQRYINWLMSKQRLDEQVSQLSVWFLMLVPALVLAILMDMLLGGVLTFVVQTAVLFIALGNIELRKVYRSYLQAASRKDDEACDLYARQIATFGSTAGVDEKHTGGPFARLLIWKNYQYYVAVVLSFIAFGAPGVVFYVLARELIIFSYEQANHLLPAAQKLMHALDFIPIRICAFGLLIVGHFSKALPYWLGGAASMQTSAENFLTDVAEHAEVLSDTDKKHAEFDATTEPKIMVKLAKRNITLLLVVTAILTLSGILV